MRDPSRKAVLAETEQYLNAIRKALLSEWDPIGIKHFAEAQGEYDSYAPHIYTLLIARRPRHELYDYLWRLETEHMGLTGNRQATDRGAIAAHPKRNRGELATRQMPANKRVSFIP